jgi:hypothetical protein
MLLAASAILAIGGIGLLVRREMTAKAVGSALVTVGSVTLGAGLVKELKLDRIVRIDKIALDGLFSRHVEVVGALGPERIGTFVKFHRVDSVQMCDAVSKRILA